MSVITTVSVSARAVTLGAALTANPGLSVRLERFVPNNDGYVPYLWASSEDVAEIETALGADADDESVDVVDTTNGETLFRMDPVDHGEGVLGVIESGHGTILDGVGQGDTWHFELRFDSHSGVTEFYEACSDRGIQVELEAVHSRGLPRESGFAYDLSEPQREALQLALREGYFEVPRRTNLTELADRLDVSDSAVSQRIRRATETVLSSSLCDDATIGREE